MTISREDKETIREEELAEERYQALLAAEELRVQQAAAKAKELAKLEKTSEAARQTFWQSIKDFFKGEGLI